MLKSRLLMFIIRRKYKIAIIFLDISFIYISIYTATLLAHQPKPPPVFYLIAAFGWLAICVPLLLYSATRYSVKFISVAVFLEWVVLNMADLYINTLRISRTSLVLMLPLLTVSVLGYRLLLRVKRFSGNRETAGERRILILGVGTEAGEIAELTKSNSGIHYNVIGFLSLEHQPAGIKVDADKILGSVDNLYKIAKREKIDEVIVALPSYTTSLSKRIEKIIKEHSGLGISFKLSHHLYESLVGRVKMSRLSDVLLFDILPEVNDGHYVIYKRVLDICASSLGLILLAPPMAIIAGILKFYEKGPVFYRQERIGELGKPFILYKFRSMVPNAEEDTGPIWAQKDDSRVTSFGRFLRRNSLDELPQLWNVLKGDMSLVGPRPERPYFINHHKELQGKRLNVKPGITGLAQINGRYDLIARHKAKYDYIYLKNCSFAFDIEILLRTFRVVLNRRGAR